MYIALGHCINYWAVIKTAAHSEHCQTFKMDHFAKKSLSVADNASVSLNIPKYPWKCLNELFRLCLSSEYAWSSYMFNRLLKMPRVLNMTRLYIWGLHRVLNMSEYGSTCHNNPWIYLTMPQYPSVCLNMSEYDMAEYC